MKHGIHGNRTHVHMKGALGNEDYNLFRKQGRHNVIKNWYRSKQILVEYNHPYRGMRTRKDWSLKEVKVNNALNLNIIQFVGIEHSSNPISTGWITFSACFMEKLDTNRHWIIRCFRETIIIFLL